MGHEDAVHEEKFRDLDIKIYRDENAESPDEWGDENLFLVGYHRDFCVERDDIITKQELIDCFTDPKRLEEIELQVVKNTKKKYHIFGLEAYIHSGVSLALSYKGNFPDRRWDVSQLGAVLCAKAEWKTEKKARTMALSHIKTWNDYLMGNVYGYVIEDKDEHIDSCYGFYGDHDGKHGALAEARAVIDAMTTKGKTDRHGQLLMKCVV